MVNSSFPSANLIKNLGSAIKHLAHAQLAHAAQRRDAGTKVEMGIEAGTEAVDEGHRFACLGFRFAASNCRTGSSGKT
jgi:hypothetical protein